MRQSLSPVFVLVTACGFFLGVFVGHHDVYLNGNIRRCLSVPTNVDHSRSLSTVNPTPLWQTTSMAQDYTPLGFENTDELWWENFDSNRTIYVAPMTGLSNTLQTIASALTVGYQNKINIKIVFNPRLFGPASWDDLFSFPRINQSRTFPDGEFVLDNTKSCNLTTAFQWDEGKYFEWVQKEDGSGEFACVLGCCWRERPYPQIALWFYRILRPSLEVQQLIANFKAEVKWDEYQWVGVHVRRTDNMDTMKGILTHGAVEDFRKKINLTDAETMLPLEKYISIMQSFVDSWAVHGTREFDGYNQLLPMKFFLATDNANARETIVNSFEEDKVVFFDHQIEDSRLRDVSWGMKLAVVDMFLLASCKVTIGTTFSTYSQAAHMIGGTLYMEPNFKFMTNSENATTDLPH